MTVRAAVALAFALGSTLCAQEPQAPAPAPKSSVELLRERIEQQQARLDEEQRKLDEMSKQLGSLEQLARPPDLVGPPAPTDAPPQKPQEPEVAEFRESDPAAIPKEEYAEQPDPLIGDFPGSIKIPSTQTSLAVGGFVKLAMVRSWNAIGSDDQFVVPSIPIAGTPEAGAGSRTSLSARQSRVHLDVRMPTEDKYLRTFIEVDFAGETGDDTELLRLRHAFGQFDMLEDGYVLAGKTWTTFMNVDSQPDIVDFEGLVGAPFRRNALLRWSRPFSEEVTFAISVENPDADIEGGESINALPDLAAGLRWAGERSHLYLAAIGRLLKAEQVANSGNSREVRGYGITASGAIGLPWGNDRDALRFGVTLGEGIGSYVIGTDSAGGQDALFDPATGDLEVLPVLGMHVAFEHWWSDTVRINLIYSHNRVDNEAFQPADAYHVGQYAAVNVLWSITPDIVLGVEQLYGIRRNHDGDSGDATQTQVAFKFSF